MPPALFDDLLLYIRDSPAMESVVGGSARNSDGWFNSRLQLIYRIAHGLTEVVQFLSVHSPVKRSTDISAGQPELDVIHLVGHRVLAVCELETSHCRRGQNVPGSL